MKRVSKGFTLIELLVVLAILALLLTIAGPRYVDRVERTRETALRTDLKVMRQAIDGFEGDQGRLPKGLEELVSRGYLKEIPVDPVTDRRDTWILVTAAELEASPSASGQKADPLTTGGEANQERSDRMASADGMADIRSGADGRSRDGSVFRDW